MIIGDSAEIAGYHTSFLYCQSNRNNICFVFINVFNYHHHRPKYEIRQIKTVSLEIHAADYYQFDHRQNGALMNKTKLASFSVNAVKCFFSVGAAQ